MSLTAALLQFYSPSSPATPFLTTTSTVSAAADRLAYQNAHKEKTEKKKSFWLDSSHFDHFGVVAMVTQQPVLLPIVVGLQRWCWVDDDSISHPNDGDERGALCLRP